MTSFRLGQWHNAIESWQRGYRAKPDPGFLYNIAQAYRLASEPDRALFFYRSFLNADPQTKARDEVEERVAQIEKLVAAERSAREATPTEPHPAPQTAAAAQAPPQRRFDLGVTAGVALWAEGFDGAASPSLSVTLSGGYAVVARPRWALRMGAQLGYSYLRDAGATDHFITVLADPQLRVRLWRERLYGFIEVGLGAQLVAGLAAGSAFLQRGAQPQTLAAFALRPAAGLELRLASRVALFLSPSLLYSPTSSSTWAQRSLLRGDIALGVSLYF